MFNSAAALDPKPCLWKLMKIQLSILFVKCPASFQSLRVCTRAGRGMEIEIDGFANERGIAKYG